MPPPTWRRARLARLLWLATACPAAQAFAVSGAAPAHAAAPRRCCRQPPTSPRLQLAIAPREDDSDLELASEPPRDGIREFGVRRLLGYLWPDRGAGGFRAKLRVLGAIALLLVAKLFIVRVPFIFKRCIDSLTPGSGLLAPAAWMLTYSVARSVYTMLQEGRYLLFTPVGQNALRRFMRDAFAHLQALDAAWLGSQSTGELSRVFARGVRGMNALLRLLVFNVVPTALEALLVVQISGRRCAHSASGAQRARAWRARGERSPRRQRCAPLTCLYAGTAFHFSLRRCSPSRPSSRGPSWSSSNASRWPPRPRSLHPPPTLASARPRRSGHARVHSHARARSR